MTRRAFRVLLFLGLIGAASLAGYQGWKLERARVQQLASAAAFDDLSQRLAQAPIELRAAQRAFVSSGQGYAYWKPSTDKVIQQIRQDLATLKTSVPRAAGAADAALEALNETMRIEKRIEEAAQAGRIPFAADLIFADGLQANLTLQRAIDAALTAARGDLEAYQRDARVQELLLAAESACIGLFLALMWYPTTPRPAAADTQSSQSTQPARPSRPAPANTSLGTASARGGLGLNATDTSSAADGSRGLPDLPLRAGADTARAEAARAVAAARDRMRPDSSAPTIAPAQAAAPASSAPPAATVDASTIADAAVAAGAAPTTATRETLLAAADLCTSLARVNDATELNGLLAQMSTQLDAAGVIVWLTAADGLSLRPALSHGYPPEAMARLERLDLTSDNATARAYRLVRPQTVNAKDSVPGAIVVPITTSAGCVGAVAAELRHGREQDATTLALARIFAAQLATLTGPSSTSTAQ